MFSKRWKSIEDYESAGGVRLSQLNADLGH